jgi:hypothetical protein
MNTNSDLAKTKKGYAKIQNCCRQALRDGYHYVWIDTCCIDKSSSAELSEAINSMYKWYAKAKVCYAYLNDVESTQDPRDNDSSFRTSEWFRRGWTLQELIAPKSVVFLAKDWVQIGSKRSLADVVEVITKVDEKVLVENLGGGVSVAKRLSWAANRKTTRGEDMAYSLMGLFGVHMPTLYGEGRYKAFTRLQEEILRVSNDHSIFAWRLSIFDEGGLLAASPSQFANSAQFSPIGYQEFDSKFQISEKVLSKSGNFTARPDYAVTNFGIRIQLPLEKDSSSPNENIWRAYLACVHGEEKAWTWIYLKKQPHKPLGHYFRPSYSAGIGYAKEIDVSSITIEEIYIARQDIPDGLHTMKKQCRFVVKMPIDPRFKFCECYPHDTLSFSGNKWVTQLGLKPGVFQTVLFRNASTGDAFAAVFGGYNKRPWSDIWTGRSMKTAKEIHDHYDSNVSEMEALRRRGQDWVKKPLSTENGRSVILTVREGELAVPKDIVFRHFLRVYTINITLQ